MGLTIRKGGSQMKKKAVADVVFCIDCTSSMKNCINNLKMHIGSFVESMSADKTIITDWQIRAVGYGDLEEGEEIQDGNPFVTNVDAFLTQLKNIKLCYGGDPPESTLDAIVHVAKTTKWRRANKIIAVFTDAPTKDLHPTTKTKFAVNSLEDMMLELTENHIKLFFWGPNDKHYNELSLLPKSEITLLAHPHADFTSGTSMQKLLETMGKTVSQESISGTL